MNHLWTKWINAATIKTISQSVSLMQQFTTEDKLFDWLADRTCQTDQHKTLLLLISSKLCRSAPETRRRFCNWSFSDPDQYFDIIFDPLVICVLRHFSLISYISVCLMFLHLFKKQRKASRTFSQSHQNQWMTSSDSNGHYLLMFYISAIDSGCCSVINDSSLSLTGSNGSETDLTAVLKNFYYIHIILVFK